MSWRHRHRHRYRVPGIPISSTHHGFDHYDSRLLAHRPAVKTALAHAPHVFLDLIFDPGHPELTHQQFLEHVHVGTTDGLQWCLGVTDEVFAVIDTGPDVVDTDLVAKALQAQPGVVEVCHRDREEWDFRLTAPRPADEVLALAIDAMVAAHRELARRMNIDIDS
jgi:hypothetical protein